MIIVRYENRLPASFDLDRVRALTRERAPVWDDRPELYFKAFLLRETGSFGAIANRFSSFYLWRHDAAYRDWLVSGGYRIVTDRFGRGPIETPIALDAQQGPARQARFLHVQDIDISLDADLTTSFAHEIERNREIATRSETVAAVVGADVQNWKFTRIVISTDEANEDRNAITHQVLHLSRPLLDTLPRAGARAATT